MNVLARRILLKSVMLKKDCFLEAVGQKILAEIQTCEKML